MIWDCVNIIEEYHAMTYQCQMSYVKCQMSNVKYQMSIKLTFFSERTSGVPPVIFLILPMLSTTITTVICPLFMHPSATHFVCVPQDYHNQVIMAQLYDDCKKKTQKGQIVNRDGCGSTHSTGRVEPEPARAR